MKLIVGLGNPGKIYIDSRHNIGFSVAKALSKMYKISLKKQRNTFCLSGKGNIGNQVVLLALPLTFMNLSGSAVAALLKKYKISPENLLVVCDDLDLELGRLKIRPYGSAGGHQGLKSIIGSLNLERFCRLRIGIGRPLFRNNIDTAGYVLSPFRKKEKEKMKEIIERATDCCCLWVTKGITESMNFFNRRRG